MNDHNKVPINSGTGIVALPASFRDPSGFMFSDKGILYRQVNQVYKENYEELMKSGLYDQLVESGCLVRHQEVKNGSIGFEGKYKVLCPEQLDFISYPYEWCFSQLKDAALLTLDIQRLALSCNMTLKDASAYNIQFKMGRPIMIDTLSFEKYAEGQPWAAYRQFCQHFLAPLALMAKKDVTLNKLMLFHLDGIPLDLTCKILPRSSWLNVGLAMHLHIHAKAQGAYASENNEVNNKIKDRKVSKAGLEGILNNIRNTVEKLKWRPGGTEWADYYSFTNYTDVSFDKKKELITDYIRTIKPSNVWDLGSNTGVFSRIASDSGIPTTAFDLDPAAVEMNYLQLKKNCEQYILPLVIDLTNPSPNLGWNCEERDSIKKRGPADCIMALALIHHLAISNNVPLDRIAAFFAELCSFLIIEFVPKEDSQVRRLLRSREDIFTNYDRDSFESAFKVYFKVMRFDLIEGSNRYLYLMQRFKQ